MEKFLSRKEEIITTLSDLAVEIEEKEGGETMEDLVKMITFIKCSTKKQGQ